MIQINTETWINAKHVTAVTRESNGIVRVFTVTDGLDGYGAVLDTSFLSHEELIRRLETQR